MASIAAKASIFEPSAPLTRVPSSSAQWEKTLQEVKLLYIQRQYKRCVARSSSILSSASELVHPVYKVYLYFYAAICYEAMGRYAHDYSRTKIPLLHSALDCFVTCLAVLPDGIPADERLASEARYQRELGSHAEDTDCEDIPVDILIGQAATELQAEIESFSVSFSSGTISTLSPSPSPLSSASSRSTSPTESIVSSITDIIEKSLDCPEDDPFLSDSGDSNDSRNTIKLGDRVVDREGPVFFPNPSVRERRLMPSPLQVRKSNQPRPLILPSLGISRASSAKGMSQNPDRRGRPFSIPLQIKLALNSDTNKPSNRKSLRDYTSSPYPNPISRPLHASPVLRPRTTFSSVRKYNSTLAFLHTQITSSIAALHTAINSTKALQQSRAASRRSLGLQRSVSFWSFSPVKKTPTDSRGSSDSCNHNLGSKPSTAGSKRMSLFETTSPAPACASSSSRSHGHESLQERIARLRDDGWETVGLKNSTRGWKGVDYYRGFCGAVLDELYLDT
ncbi:hypothetical protein BJY01DRAFT_249900 [Aspergillus pseudoustus]|uniref:Uncharacterized protein n=1 Tax=Aspergillus pseudoustus TaxID=1810923 RepID=A0ABR4JKY6_9EURO